MLGQISETSFVFETTNLAGWKALVLRPEVVYPHAPSARGAHAKVIFGANLPLDEFACDRGFRGTMIPTTYY